MHQIFSFFSNLLCLPYAFIEPLSSLAHDPNHRHDLVGTVAAGGRHVPEVSLDRRPLGILVAFWGATFLRHCRHMRHFAAIQDVVLREYNCNPTMIMSAFPNIEMSSSLIDCPFSQGGRDGRRGQSTHEWEGTAAPVSVTVFVVQYTTNDNMIE